MALPSIMIGQVVEARGVLHTAPIGATLPTSAGESLEADFETLGAIGPEGFSITPNRNLIELEVLGGSVAREIGTSYNETASFTLMEAGNAAVLKALYGESNVIVDEASGEISIAKNADLPEPASWVITLKDGDSRRRITIEKGQIKVTGAVVYVHSDAIKYPVEIKCFEDETGNSSNEYLGAA